MDDTTMDDSTMDITVLPTEEEQLDQEIEDLQTQVRRLKRHLSHHTTNILSSTTLPTLPSDTTPLLQTSTLQTAHNQTSLYRTCASITTFRVQDPDPEAHDSGRVLGIRIESFSSSSGRYQRPYYIFLNKPYIGAGKDLLRIHRHTLPPAINIAELAARYLPYPRAARPSGIEIAKVGKQELRGFVGAVRREIVGWGNRGAIVKSVRKRAGIDEKRADMKLVDFSAVDAEARQMRVEFVDGELGRVVMDSKGEVERCVVFGEEGRDRQLERRLLGGGNRIEAVVERMLEA